MRRLRRALLAFIGTATILASVPIGVPAAPVADFRARVQRSIARIAEIYSVSDESEGTPAEKIAEVRALLPPRETIETTGGPIEVDNTWLVRDLAAYEASDDLEVRSSILDVVSTRLAELDVQIEAFETSAPRDVAAERERLARILAGPEFRDPADNPVQRFMREVREQLASLLERLLRALFGADRGATFDAGVRAVVFAVGAAALLLLVRAIAQAIARRRSGDKRIRERRTVLGEEVDEATTASDLAAAARELAARGEYRLAIRKLFVALLYELDENNLVRLHSEATNREYVALVREIGRLHPVMASMADTFDRVWYGSEPADAARFAAFERQHSEASAIVRQSAGAAARR